MTPENDDIDAFISLLKVFTIFHAVNKTCLVSLSRGSVGADASMFMLLFPYMDFLRSLFDLVEL